MKPFTYFLMGVSITLNAVLAIDYIKKANKCSKLEKNMDSQPRVGYINYTKGDGNKS